MWRPEDCERAIAHFAARTFGPDSSILATLEHEVALGKPAAEILRVARERSCELIVISTHGLTGMRKLFFGSTTERVAARDDQAQYGDAAARSGSRRVMEDAEAADSAGLSFPWICPPHPFIRRRLRTDSPTRLPMPMILVHVIEPLKSRLTTRPHVASIEADRRAAAEDGLSELLATIPASGPSGSVGRLRIRRKNSRR